MEETKTTYNESGTDTEDSIVETLESKDAQNVMRNGVYEVINGKEVETTEIKKIEPTYSNKKDFEWIKEGFKLNDVFSESEYYDELSYRKNLMWLENMRGIVATEVTPIFSNFDWLCKYLKGCNLPQPSICNYKQYHMMATIMLPNGSMTIQAIPETRDKVDKNDGHMKKELFRYRWEISTDCQFHLTHVTDDQTLIKLYNMWDVKFMIIFTLSKLLKTDIFKTIQEEAFNGGLVN